MDTVRQAPPVIANGAVLNAADVSDNVATNLAASHHSSGSMKHSWCDI
jgi:hypothetical protein